MKIIELWQSACRWLHSLGRAVGAMRVVRSAHYALPLICFSLLGPFFELWADRAWLWGIWIALILAWALCAMAIYGERLTVAETALERAKDTAGLLWSVVGEIGKRRQKAVRPAEFRVHVQSVQMTFLRHLVHSMAHDLGLSSTDLHANWMVLTRDVLKTKVRDRPVEQRPATRELSLATHARGAALAASKREIYIETDTSIAAEYGEALPYRSFISVPILVGEDVIGVINVDSIRPSTFVDGFEWQVKEVGYIIGLLEVECWED